MTYMIAPLVVAAALAFLWIVLMVCRISIKWRCAFATAAASQLFIFLGLGLKAFSEAATMSSGQNPGDPAKLAQLWSQSFQLISGSTFASAGLLILAAVGFALPAKRAIPG
jgi:hypothetical protein